MGEAFYLPVADGRYVATEHTVGPWDPASQHAGPPSALLGRAVEQCVAAQPERSGRAAMIARITVEILGPLPVGELTLAARVLRPGRSVELIEAELSAGGRPAASARAWSIRTADLDLPVGTTNSADAAPPRPDQAMTAPSDWDVGYLRAVEWRFARGGFGEPGRATVWTRLRYPLVPDEEPSPLQRVLAVADSGNGVSGVLDVASWLFINTELTVHLHRPAEGAWVCLDAATTVQPHGVGLAESVLYDERGRIGRGAQALLIGPR